MKWNGIIDLTPSASGSQTNTAGNIRNIVVHKGTTFPTGTSIPQQGQMFYFTGTSSSSFPSPALYMYDGTSWQAAGTGGGGPGTSGYSGFSGYSGAGGGGGFSGLPLFVAGFSNANLSGGSVYVVGHSLGQSYPFVEVYDNTDSKVIPDAVNIYTGNSLGVNLVSFAPISGTWHVSVSAGTSGYSGFSGYSGPTGNAYTLGFSNGNLSSGVLSVGHSLGQSYPIVEIYNNSNNKILPDGVTTVDGNNITVDLTSFGTLSGTWHLAVNSGGASGYSGWSGYSGYSGIGTSGYSGFSGYSAAWYRGTFTSASLSNSILTITHSKGLSAPYTVLVQIYDNNAKMITPDDITGATNSFAVDLTSFNTPTPISGTWGYVYAA